MSDEIPDTPGRLLAAARLRRGWSLEDVSERSRVPVAALAALDSDDWSDFPAAVYTRGFMRLYAREVGVDPEVAIGLLDARLAEQEALEARVQTAGELEARERDRSRWVAGALALAAALLVVVLAFNAFAPRPGVAQEQDAAPPIAAD